MEIIKRKKKRLCLHFLHWKVFAPYDRVCTSCGKVQHWQRISPEYKSDPLWSWVDAFGDMEEALKFYPEQNQLLNHIKSNEGTEK